MRSFKMLLLLLSSVLLCSCGDLSSTVNDYASKEFIESLSVDTSFAENSADMFTDRDYEIDFDSEECITVHLEGSTATSSSASVQIKDGIVTLTQDGTYYITGTLENGMLVVNPPNTAKMQIVFDNVNIHSETSAALYVLSGDKIFLTLAPNSENILSGGESFVAVDDNNIDSTLFSKQDLTINGEGKLIVTSPAGHGIVSKDDLLLTGGIYEINASSHGLSANDSVRITNSVLDIKAGKDGIQADNDDDSNLGFVYLESGTFTIQADGDGISASGYLQILGGKYEITAGGGAETSPSEESAKGLKATGSMALSGGTFHIDSADDGVHSNISIVVTGGEFTVSTGDDGFHANETLSVIDGKIRVTKSYEGLEALNISICGGDISLYASDDGLNAAGGTDSSGFGGGFGGEDGFGGGRPGGGRPGGPGGQGGHPDDMSAGNGSILISGGTLYINASGDGIDSNGTLSITGGHTTVCGPTRGDTAILDYDRTAEITGGTFIGTGASGGMARTFSESDQGVLALTVGNQHAGTLICLEDSDGAILFSCTPELSFGLVILSSPDMKKGETYTITVGSQSDSFQAN